jgi:exopolysaccharide biosynthesis polyprenyl glycosylphosphotransferase
MIPRRFFWIFDLLALLLSFLLFVPAAPILHFILASTGCIQGIPAFSSQINSNAAPFTEQGWILFVAVFPMIIALDIAGQGKWMNQSRSKIILASFGVAFIGMSLATLIPFLLINPPIQLSRMLLFSYGIVSSIILSAYRLALQQYYKKQNNAGRYVKNVLIVGRPLAIEWTTLYFKENINPNEYRIFGCLDAHCEDLNGQGISTMNGEPPSVEPVNVLGNVEQLGELLITKPIHEVIAIQPASNGIWMSQVIQDCDYLGILLRIVPESLVMKNNVRLHALFPSQPLHLPAVVLTPPHLDSDVLFIKRLIDAVVSAALLILLSPLFLLIAAAIKLTCPGLPVFYKWRVVGRYGVEFTGYKFTTMVADADERKRELIRLNEMTGPVFKIKDDPRITPLGRFLRKYSLNELPQLWSVLKGDMSLVGPRPAFRHELDRYEFWHKRKLSIRPGITCLWQIRGRNKIVRFDDWVTMDLEYIDNWSLWLDIKILLRTAWVVVAGSGS